MNNHLSIGSLMRVILLATILLSACATIPASTPTLEPSPIAVPSATSVPPTATSIPPTVTPIPPTATSIPPTATSIPKPTAIPTPAKFVDRKFVMTYEAYKIATDFGQTWYSKGYYLLEIALYDAMLEYSLQPDQLAWVYSMRAEDYAALGHYDLAIEDYLRTLDLGIRKPTTLNNLCWDYGITDHAQDALPYCEEAVKQNASAQNLDSRGLVYALLGKFPDALSDFEAALKLGGYPSDEEKTQREGWVTTLKAGKNPITMDVLKKLRVEESPITTDPFYTGDLKLSYLRKQYEDKGYVFKETTIDGQAGLIGTLQNGDCKAEIVLLGSEDSFKGGSSTIMNCGHNDLSAHAWEFNYAFCKDLKEFGRAFVWQDTDCYYVIEGKKSSDLTPTFGGFQFKVERTNVGDNEGIIVTAKPLP